MCSYTVSEGISDTGRRIQAILFVAGTPVAAAELAEVLSLHLSIISGEIRRLGDFLRGPDRGFSTRKLQRMADGDGRGRGRYSLPVPRYSQTQKIRLSRARSKRWP